MKRAAYPETLGRLVEQLKRLPGIGPRSAERIALWIVQSRDARPIEISDAFRQVAESVRTCSRCGFFAEGDLCAICADDERVPQMICVVERATDIFPLERTGVFRGRYHALGGRISPLDHVSPEDLRIDSLLRRISQEQVSEIILALSGDVEGEATANYLSDLLRETAVTVTRIAQGMPAGIGLESADEVTLARALTARTVFRQ